MYKLVIMSDYFSVMEAYRGIMSYTYNFKSITFEQQKGKKTINIDSPFIVVDEDRDIKTITKQEVIDFLLVKVLEDFSAECEKRILKGFYSLTKDAFYGFSTMDQMNFTQQLLLVSLDPSIESVEWKTEDKGILLHTKDEFINVCKEGEKHKRETIGKYWEIKDYLKRTIVEYSSMREIGSFDEEYQKVLAEQTPEETGEVQPQL
ncbi:hypothetical protein [Peribacillus asahii]|uniref:DUF4376 domain-containing protein n=1 Tax=Peribacillus asahii TaxID=228899 RepID=UPI00381106D5